MAARLRPKYLIALAAAPAAVALCACDPGTRVAYVFDHSTMPDERWNQIKKECEYEAAKAALPAPTHLTTLVWEEILIRCTELKGAPFKGRKLVRV